MPTRRRVVNRKGSQGILSQPGQYRSKVSRVSCVVLVVALISLVNTLVLHGRLDQHALQPGTKQGESTAARNANRLYHPYQQRPGGWFPTNNDTQHITSPSSHLLRAPKHRRVQGEEAAVDDSLVLTRLKLALEAQKQDCSVGNVKKEDREGNDTSAMMAPFGLLRALKSREQRHDDKWHCAIPSRAQSTTTTNEASTEHRLVLIVTSSGRHLRNLFVQLLKWLHLEQITPTKKGEVPIRLERIWVLLPTSQFIHVQQDEDYGSRLLEWDRLHSHPLNIRFADSFWGAVEQVEPIESLPLVWLDGDRVSEWTFDWWRLFQHQYETKKQWQQQQTRSTKQSGSDFLHVSSILHIPSSFASKLPCGTNSTFLPDLHELAVWDDPNHLCWLSHPLLHRLQDETSTFGGSDDNNNDDDWEMAKLAAAVWLSWLAQHVEVDTGQDGNTRHSNVVNKDLDKILTIVSYLGGLPPVPLRAGEKTEAASG